MLQTIEATTDEHGNICFPEYVKLPAKGRLLITVLEQPRLVREENKTWARMQPEASKTYPMWSQYDAFEAADVLMKALETENPL